MHIEITMKMYLLWNNYETMKTYRNNYGNVHTGTNTKTYIEVVIYMHFTQIATLFKESIDKLQYLMTPCFTLIICLMLMKY